MRRLAPKLRLRNPNGFRRTLRKYKLITWDRLKPLTLALVVTAVAACGGSATKTPIAPGIVNLQVDVKVYILEKLEGLAVPPEMEMSQAMLVATSNEWIAIIERAIDVLEAADPESTVGGDLIYDPEIGSYVADEIMFRARNACKEIEGIALDNGFVADLGCSFTFRR